MDACQDVIQDAINLPIDIDPRPNKYFEKLEHKLDKIQRSVVHILYGTATKQPQSWD